MSELDELRAQIEATNARLDTAIDMLGAVYRQQITLLQKQMPSGAGEDLLPLLDKALAHLMRGRPPLPE